ncbi:MAG: hypothetical protein RL685_6026 [Pseudomonadota bacterium]
MKTVRPMYLGGLLPVAGGHTSPLQLPPQHLATHGVVLGMTGSGKTGLLMVMVEEALRSQVPVLMIDVKGDLPNLLLSFPSFQPDLFVPWTEGYGTTEEAEVRARAQALASEREQQLASWQLGLPDVASFAASTHVRVLTPGSTAEEPLHILSSLERRTPAWDSDVESARAALSAAISLVLRLIGRESDPAKSREHVLLAVLAERRLLAGQSAELGALLAELAEPPLARIGALEMEEFLSLKERRRLAAALNTLLASPTFASWRTGVSLDIREWLTVREGRTPAVIVSVAHLDDEERNLVLGVLLEEVLSYTRSLPGSRQLRALVVFDEVYGLLPPHPANPPSKRPTVALMKQGRAFGVGVIVATQNPMDLDYRALSNAGFWAVGRLQTDADRARVVESLAHAEEAGSSPAELGGLLRKLGPRWFLLRDVHASTKLALLRPRWALSYLRGPMTQSELRRALRGERRWAAVA